MAVRVLFYNTFLLRVLRLPGGRWVHTKPAVEPRVDEIAGALAAASYDVAALAEVFSSHDRERLVRRATGAAPDADHLAVGPPARPPSTLTSSGLATLSAHPIVRSATHVLRHRGRRLRDSDVWASKGVLLTEVDLGQAGNLELYSTHLMYGGDLVRSEARHRNPELHDVRQAQVEELLAFVDATHRPGNVALVVGDFNIDAEGRGPNGRAPSVEGADAAARLAESMDRAGFDDVWARWGEGPGWTCDLLAEPERFPTDPSEPDLCAEPADPSRPGDHLARIDLAFLQRAVPGHDVEVEVQRIRRRPFERPADARSRDLITTMSDHLGLHLELEVRSPT